MKCDEIFAALAMLEKERGISQSFMMEKIVQALTTAYKRDHEGVENVVVDVDEGKRELKMFVQKEVVDEVENPGTQMSLDDAKAISANVNIVGGIALRDTACDLSVCLSMVSSLLDRPVSDKLIAIGEVGLGGEVRSVPNLEQRLHEAERIGFERAVVPKHSLNHLNPADYPGMKLIGAAYISDAINALKTDRL